MLSLFELHAFGSWYLSDTVPVSWQSKGSLMTVLVLLRTNLVLNFQLEPVIPGALSPEAVDLQHIFVVCKIVLLENVTFKH